MTSASKNEAAVVITSLYARSDVGVVRTNNEDNFVIADLRSGRTCTAPQSITRTLKENRLLLAVSDGMGGAQAGEVASALAVYGLKLELLSQPADSDTIEGLVKAVEKINKLIWRESQSNSERKGMGATMTAAVIEGEHQLLGNRPFCFIHNFDRLPAGHDQSGPKQQEQKKDPTAGWRCLADFRSDERVGFCFWDSGNLILLIKESDLAGQNFSDIRAVIETS